jgi:hypothetical protein
VLIWCIECMLRVIGVWYNDMCCVWLSFWGLISGFESFIFFMVRGRQPLAQPPTWRTRVSLLVWMIPFDLSGLGDPTSSYASAGIALRVIWPHKPHHTIGGETEKIHLIKSRTGDLPAYSIVPQPTTLLRVPIFVFYTLLFWLQFISRHLTFCFVYTVYLNMFLSNVSMCVIKF